MCVRMRVCVWMWMPDCAYVCVCERAVAKCNLLEKLGHCTPTLVTAVSFRTAPPRLAPPRSDLIRCDARRQAARANRV